MVLNSEEICTSESQNERGGITYAPII
jgi:hypothetical protein